MDSLTKKASIKPGGEPSYLWKALVNNMEEEKRTKIHIQKLQKALSLCLREIDKEKTALEKFLVKLHKTSGYLPQKEF